MSGDSLNGDDLGDQRGENDVELRELVYQSLERDGLITRLKAQLRAAVFKTIEKAANPSDSTHKPAYEGATGRICRALVLDWLEQSHLLYTHDVFRVETSGPNHPPPLTQSELLEQLHLDATHNKSQPILHALLTQSPARVSAHRWDQTSVHLRVLFLSVGAHHFPPAAHQAIDRCQVPNGENQRYQPRARTLSHTVRSRVRCVRPRSLPQSKPVPVINLHGENRLRANLSEMDASVRSSTNAVGSKPCETTHINVTARLLHTPSAYVLLLFFPSRAPLQPLSARSTATNEQAVTRARRALSPPSDSSSSSMSTSTSENPRKHVYDFPLPTTLDSNKNGVKKSTDIAPPPLLNFNNSNSANDDDDDTTSSIFSRRNATPAALNHLRNIEDIAGGDVTPRTRTAIQKPSANGNKDLPVEYDDESMSQSQISSIDDVTVDKASPSPSAHIDFLEDL